MVRFVGSGSVSVGLRGKIGTERRRNLSSNSSNGLSRAETTDFSDSYETQRPHFIVYTLMVQLAAVEGPERK